MEKYENNFECNEDASTNTTGNDSNNWEKYDIPIAKGHKQKGNRT